MKITTSNLIRWAGLSAVVGGCLFVGIQPIHPPEILPSFTTSTWAIVHYVGVVMCFLILLGITGIYARQVKEAGWLGLAGFLLFGLMWFLTAAMQFAEAFIVPLLATAAPTFVDGFFGIVNGHPIETNLGALPALYALVGILYVLSGLLFGIATLRAGILSRWAAGMFGFGAVSSVAFALLPPALEPLATVPVGLGLAWLGYALWSERREPGSQRIPARERAQLRPTPVA